MRKLLFLLMASLAVSVPAYAKKDKEKKKKVKWKQVEELKDEPKDQCEFLETVEGDGEGMFVITNNQSKKKLKQNAKKAAAAVGGNAYWMVEVVHHPHSYTFKSKTYWCDEMPPTVEDDK